MPPQIKQAKLETLEAIIKEVEELPWYFGKDPEHPNDGKTYMPRKKVISKDDLITTLQAEKELIENN